MVQTEFEVAKGSEIPDGKMKLIEKKY